MAASVTWRIRAFLKSIPPTFVLPTCEGSGSCSRVASLIKHWSMQLRASANLSRMARNSATIRGNLSSERPQSSSAVSAQVHAETLAPFHGEAVGADVVFLPDAFLLHLFVRPLDANVMVARESFHPP